MNKTALLLWLSKFPRKSAVRIVAHKKTIREIRSHMPQWEFVEASRFMPGLVRFVDRHDDPIIAVYLWWMVNEEK